MPNSPSVKFRVENNNVAVSTPQIGVSTILARTEKGPFLDPSVLVSSLTQFKNIYGSEIVPDGTPSNIEKALTLGSKLRIIRVPGSGYYKGILYGDVEEVPTSSSQQVPTAVMSIGTAAGSCVTIGFNTKTYDQRINGASTFQVAFSRSANGNTLVYSIYPKGMEDIILESGPVFTYQNKSGVNPTSSIDFLQLNNFFHNSQYLEPKVVSSTLPQVGSLEALVMWLKDIDGTEQDLYVDFNGNGDLSNDPESVVCEAIPGSSGSTPLKQDWIDSLEYIKDFSDSYQVACSHLHQHLVNSADQLAVHKAAKEIVSSIKEFIYYIEVPKYNAGTTTPMTKAQMVAWVNTCMNTIGNSAMVAYFAGGIKYYNDYGILTDADVLGSIIGLGDASAANYGPWLSFAGLNRGILENAQGPASVNYGAPSRYEDLNELAQHYLNMVVVKDTPNGKRTMLWHCFTSQVKQDSFKFISVVRLVLYLKKLLRPILDSYIEEPNIWTTWNQLYFRVKPELDRLVEVSAISEYAWNGDQFVTSYEDLQVNNEADVRQGKYKVNLVFKEVVPMQDIEVTFVLDKASNTVSAVINE